MYKFFIGLMATMTFFSSVSWSLAQDDVVKILATEATRFATCQVGVQPTDKENFYQFFVQGEKVDSSTFIPKTITSVRDHGISYACKKQQDVFEKLRAACQAGNNSSSTVIVQDEFPKPETSLLGSWTPQSDPLVGLNYAEIGDLQGPEIAARMFGDTVRGVTTLGSAFVIKNGIEKAARIAADAKKACCTSPSPRSISRGEIRRNPNPPGPRPNPGPGIAPSGHGGVDDIPAGHGGGDDSPPDGHGAIAPNGHGG